MSSDGSLVLGVSFPETPKTPTVWTWNESDGLQAVPLYSAEAMSGDGSTVVGSLGNVRATMPAIWHGGTVIGVDPGTEFTGGYFTDVSDDGAIAVGNASNGFPPIYSWRPIILSSQQDGLELIECRPDESCFAHAISGNGHVVVGSYAPIGSTTIGRAFQWTEESGRVDIGPGHATDISSNGDIITGFNVDGMFRWTKSGGMQTIGTWNDGFISNMGPFVSPDGMLIFTWSHVDAGALIWDEYHGLRNLSIVLHDQYGLEGLPQLSKAEAISADRKTISVGSYDDTDGWRLWLVHLDIPLGPPPAGDANDDGVIDVADLDLFSAAIRAGRTESYWDVDGSGALDQADLHYVVHDILQTWIGDVDLNGQFNSDDFVQVFVAGQYEDTVAGNSTWATGDWNGDGDFTSSDMVVAFVDGGYEQGPRPNVVAVPEPNGLSWMLFCLCFARLRRRRAPA
jgi:hypothetical protein